MRRSSCGRTARRSDHADRALRLSRRHCDRLDGRPLDDVPFLPEAHRRWDRARDRRALEADGCVARPHSLRVGLRADHQAGRSRSAQALLFEMMSRGASTCCPRLVSACRATRASRTARPRSTARSSRPWPASGPRGTVTIDSTGCLRGGLRWGADPTGRRARARPAGEPDVSLESRRPRPARCIRSDAPGSNAHLAQDPRTPGPALTAVTVSTICGIRPRPTDWSTCRADWSRSSSRLSR